MQNIAIKNDGTKIWQHIAFVIFATAPIIFFTWKACASDSTLFWARGDWDYFAQMYEAARISLLHYHQFPWWNPWTLGGIPLYANPQFGLISFQMPLVLLFGTLRGLHFALLIYFVFGFWGMYFLLKRLNANSRLHQILLSYIWTFSGFTVWHLMSGHLTFATYLLAPWFFLALLNIRSKYGWLWLALVISFLVNQAAHYIIIQCLVIGAAVAIYQLFWFYRVHKPLHFMVLIRPYLWSASLTVLLCAHKLFFAFQYIGDYSRPTFIEPVLPFKVTWLALTARHAVKLQQFHVPAYGWVEYVNYFGVVTLLLFLYLLGRDLWHHYKMQRKMPPTLKVLLGATLLSFALTLGNFMPFSPYELLHHLPLFREMRVPARWIGWFAFGVILYLAHLPRKPWIYALLICSALDVASVNYPIFNHPQVPYSPPRHYAKFQQYAAFMYDPNRVTPHLLQATQANRGEAYGYEPILGFNGRILPVFQNLTNRCGINQGCQFVLTDNAKVLSWSPLKITLQRTAPGTIRLNMNPGYKWQVNGKNIFATDRILELQKNFAIDDPRQNIIIQFVPHQQRR